jgi:undecaprenyl diphosphate synthase
LGVDDASRKSFFTGKRSLALLQQFDPLRTPEHIAIIMDGNGRWAAKRGMPRLAGHRAGAGAVREVIAASIELGVRFLTIYSFSSENWSRPADEVHGLMSLFVEVLERELANLERMNVRVRLIGAPDALPLRTADAFNRCVTRTAGNTGLTLVVALNYGARDDMVKAVRDIAAKALSGTISVDDIDTGTISEHLSTTSLPDPDLVIRTSGEMRLSNFLLFEIAYSELWVTSVLWPDFRRGDLLKAVVDYQTRERRYGGSA